MKKKVPAIVENKIRTVWLKYDEAKYAMYCTLCQDNGKTNSFTAGNSNFRTSTLKKHVVHSDHQASVLVRSHSKI